MSYKEQIFKELSVIKKSGGKFTFDGINPKTVRHYVFIFNEVHGSDLACSIVDGVATVFRKAKKKDSVRQYVYRELYRLKHNGGQLALNGDPAVLRMNISRLRKKLGLELSTKVINGKLHVVVMGGEMMGEWISVKDKLPEKHQMVVVADIGFGEIYSVAGAVYITDGYFSAEDSGLAASNYDGDASISLDMNITHWMPLQPPKDTP